MKKRQASLFVGRWQPFHKGHKALIETVLKKGKPVVIAIRDTKLTHKNPYTLAERAAMIRKALKRYGSLVKVITIPDIDEICYGRDVGYRIRRIYLDADTEAISGTKTRKKHPPTHPIIWLTGQSGSGKTTLANILKEKLNAVVLDGNEMRESVSLGAGFSKEDRETHNLRVARLAFVLARQSPVIVSVIAPFESTRKKIDAMIKPVWVYVKRNVPPRKTYPYEPPKKPHITVDSSAHTGEVNAKKILKFLKKGS